MGKKRIVKNDINTKEEIADSSVKNDLKDVPKKHIDFAVLNVRSTYNNTILTLTDKKGRVLGFSSSGSLGFKGAKKGTPFAAAKVGETLALKAQSIGIKDVSVVVKGVGLGRESGIRGFISRGINLISIKDATPVPHNGPKPKKPRRV